jgi:hypothetical protein
MIDCWNDRLLKWLTVEMIAFWNDWLLKWSTFELIDCWNDRLSKWLSAKKPYPLPFVRACLLKIELILLIISRRRFRFQNNGKTERRKNGKMERGKGGEMERRKQNQTRTEWIFLLQYKKLQTGGRTYVWKTLL